MLQCRARVFRAPQAMNVAQHQGLPKLVRMVHTQWAWPSRVLLVLLVKNAHSKTLNQ
jgi:hypothetical protein